MPRLSAALALIAALGLLPAAPVQAVQRAYVSANGNDANTATGCPSTAPCRWFATAVSVVDPNGEVVAMDSGAYGGVVLTQSVSLIAAPGVYAGISVFSGAGVTINTPGLNVVLRGMTINGMGGSTGVSIANAASVSIENCVVANFSGSGGAAISVNGPVPVRIADTVLRNNFYGVALQGGAIADISTSRLLGNTQAGLYVYGAAAGTTSATLGTSLVTGGAYGVDALANAAGATVKVSLIRSTVSNSGTGVNAESNAGSAVLALSGSLVTGNTTGLRQNGAGATLKSLGNNTVSENTTNVSGTLSTVPPL